MQHSNQGCQFYPPLQVIPVTVCVWGEDVSPWIMEMGNSNIHLLNEVGVGIMILVPVGTRCKIIKLPLYIYMSSPNSVINSSFNFHSPFSQLPLPLDLFAFILKLPSLFSLFFALLQSQIHPLVSPFSQAQLLLKKLSLTSHKPQNSTLQPSSLASLPCSAVRRFVRHPLLLPLSEIVHLRHSRLPSKICFFVW